MGATYDESMMRTWMIPAAGVILGAATAFAGSPTSTTTSTTTVSLASTTSTLPGGCLVEPSFDSILCRLDNLVVVVDQSSDLGRLKGGVLGSAQKARKQCGKAASVGTGKVASTQLKKCAKTIDTFRHKLDSNNAHKLIVKDVRDELRDTLAAPIRTDVNTLREKL
jgi:hypothetical protein